LFVCLAVIEFLAPAWLGGMGVVGLPVLAHLLSRRRGRAVVFPAVRFFEQAIIHQRRRVRLRDFLLLTLRMVTLALIVAAFAQPVWYGSSSTLTAEVGSVVGNPTDGVQVVFVVDASASMRRVEHGRTLYDRAVQETIERLDSLDPEKDRAGIVLAGAEPMSVLPRLSGNVEALRSGILEATITWERADMSAAIGLAHSLLDEDGRIIVLSDMQGTQFDDGSIADAHLDPSIVTFVPISVSSDVSNLAVGDVRLRPVGAIVGQSVLVSAEVGNFGWESAQVRVSVSVDDETRSSLMVTMKPFESRTVSIPVIIDEPGFHVVSVSVPSGDGFGIDDEVRVGVVVRSKRRVGVLTADTVGDQEAASYFVGAALAPDERSPVEVVRIDASGGGATVCDGFDVVVVCGAGAVDGDILQRLRDAVVRGGVGLFWVIDSEDSVESLAALGSLVDSVVNRLPVSDLAWIDGAEDRPIKSVSLDVPMSNAGQLIPVFRDPPLRALADGSARDALLKTVFSERAVCRVGSNGEPLLVYESGEPALVSGRVGEGRLCVLTGSIGPRHSSLIHGPIFPVLMHEVVRFLEPADYEPIRFLVGDRATMRFRSAVEDGRLLRFSPEGLRCVSARSVDDDLWVTRLDPLDEPMLMTVHDDPDSDVPVAWAECVFDSRESDFRSIGLEDATGNDSLRADGSASAEDVTDQYQEPIGSARLRPDEYELWPMCLVLALVMLAVEHYLIVAQADSGTGVSPVTDVHSHPIQKNKSPHSDALRG